ncbi:hypothetical protein HPP92_027691 [Vanilla planifolia]|uniref:Uncharacterized protein n=1 Tax=Vanilla planifolia TaxID=51239 RepID=A0A835PAA8_VANPL|nr:hypothetical protein HPP92_027691 [Vanilla planifolia]
MNCIWKHPYAPRVYLACDLLGQEDILIEVSKTFGSKIYVDKIKNPRSFHALSLVAPEILSKDGLGKLKEMASKQIAKARAYFEPEPIFIRPSAQWYATVDQVEKVGFKESSK